MSKVDEAYAPNTDQSESVIAENAKWDALVASEPSQRVLERLADEALADIQAGRARPMAFTEEGDIAPG